MSLKGGYQIIDLKNEPFDTTRGTTNYYKNIYHDISNSHAKMIIISGLNMDGVKYNDYEVIFYEVREGDDVLYQCILRRIWETLNYKCFTKFCTIYPDDTVKCTVDEFTYEILPDDSLNPLSDNAVQNKVITKAFDKLDILTKSYGEDKCYLRSITPSGNIEGTSYCSGNYIVFKNNVSWGSLANNYYITFDEASEFNLYLQYKYPEGTSQIRIFGYNGTLTEDTMIFANLEFLVGSYGFYNPSQGNYISLEMMGSFNEGHSCDGIIVFLP